MIKNFLPIDAHLNFTKSPKYNNFYFVTLLWDWLIDQIYASFEIMFNIVSLIHHLMCQICIIIVVRYKL